MSLKYVSLGGPSSESLYLKTLVNPEGYLFGIPDEEMSPTHLTSESMEHSLRISTDGTALVAYLPKDITNPARLYWKPAGSPKYGFVRHLGISRDLSETYQRGRHVSGCLHFCSNTRSVNAAQLAGEIQMVSLQNLPDLIGATEGPVDFSSIMPLARGPSGRLDATPLDVGAVMLATPAADVSLRNFLTPSQWTTPNLVTFTDYYSAGNTKWFGGTINYTAPGSANVFTSGVPDPFILPNMFGQFTLSADLCFVVNGTATGSDGVFRANLVVVQEYVDMQTDAFTQVRTTVASREFSGPFPSTSGALRSNVVLSGNFIADAEIIGIDIDLECVSLDSPIDVGVVTTFHCNKVEWASSTYLAPGTSEPAEIAIISEAAPGQSLLIEGVQNYEVVPRGTFSKDIVANWLPSNATEIELVKSVFAAGFPTVFRGPEYRYFLKKFNASNMATYNGMTLMSAGAADVFRNFASGLKTRAVRSLPKVLRLAGQVIGGDDGEEIADILSPHIQKLFSAGDTGSSNEITYYSLGSDSDEPLPLPIKTYLGEDTFNFLRTVLADRNVRRDADADQSYCDALLLYRVAAFLDQSIVIEGDDIVLDRIIEAWMQVEGNHERFICMLEDQVLRDFGPSASGLVRTEIGTGHFLERLVQATFPPLLGDVDVGPDATSDLAYGAKDVTFYSMGQKDADGPPPPSPEASVAAPSTAHPKSSDANDDNNVIPSVSYESNGLKVIRTDTDHPVDQRNHTDYSFGASTTATLNKINFTVKRRNLLAWEKMFDGYKMENGTNKMGVYSKIVNASSLNKFYRPPVNVGFFSRVTPLDASSEPTTMEKAVRFGKANPRKLMLTRGAGVTVKERVVTPKNGGDDIVFPGHTVGYQKFKHNGHTIGIDDRMDGESARAIMAAMSYGAPGKEGDEPYYWSFGDNDKVKNGGTSLGLCAFCLFLGLPIKSVVLSGSVPVPQTPLEVNGLPDVPIEPIHRASVAAKLLTHMTATQPLITYFTPSVPLMDAVYKLCKKYGKTIKTCVSGITDTGGGLPALIYAPTASAVRGAIMQVIQGAQRESVEQGYDQDESGSYNVEEEADAILEEFSDKLRAKKLELPKKSNLIKRLKSSPTEGARIRAQLRAQVEGKAAASVDDDKVRKFLAREAKDFGSSADVLEEMLQNYPDARSAKAYTASKNIDMWKAKVSANESEMVHLWLKKRFSPAKKNKKKKKGISKEDQELFAAIDIDEVEEDDDDNTGKQEASSSKKKSKSKSPALQEVEDLDEDDDEYEDEDDEDSDNDAGW